MAVTIGLAEGALKAAFTEAEESAVTDQLCEISLDSLNCPETVAAGCIEPSQWLAARRC